MSTVHVCKPATVRLDSPEKPPASLKEAPDPMMWNDQAALICRCNVGCEVSNNKLTSNGAQRNIRQNIHAKLSLFYHQGDWLSEISQVTYSTSQFIQSRTQKNIGIKTMSVQHSRSWNGFGFRSIASQVSRMETNLNILQQYPLGYVNTRRHM